MGLRNVGNVSGFQRRLFVVAETGALASRIEGWRKHPDPLQPVAETDESNGELIASLMRSGIVTPSLTDGKMPHFLSFDATDAFPFRGTIVPFPDLSLKHMLHFVRACIRIRFELRFKKLKRICQRISARKERHELERSRDELERTKELVRVFRFLTPLLYSAKGKCLYDSLTLVEFLASFGIFPTWIIAVSTRPFEAHSWVQTGGVLLNEKLERADEFEPILAI